MPQITKVNKKCLFCKKKFKVNFARKNKAKYCSCLCYWESKQGKSPWNKGKKFGYKSRPKMKGHIPWNKNKKTPLEVRLKQSKVRTGKYGNENHPNWKGGITPENKKIRDSIDYELWRIAVFERDNFICQKTGERGGKLHSHHIQNFADFPELRFAIDNGITLSEKAHREFHKTYGVKNNTKKQLKKFLGIRNAYANIYMEEAEQEIKKQLKSRLEVILTDPDNYLRGQLEDLIKEL